MSFRAASIVLFLAPVAASQVQLPQQPPNGVPNIVLVVLDDPNPSHLGLAGYPIPVTPSFDALANQGVIFRCVQTCPRCAPSITQLLSGRECLYTEACWNGISGVIAVPERILPAVLE